MSDTMDEKVLYEALISYAREKAKAGLSEEEIVQALQALGAHEKVAQYVVMLIADTLEIKESEKPVKTQKNQALYQEVSQLDVHANIQEVSEFLTSRTNSFDDVHIALCCLLTDDKLPLAYTIAKFFILHNVNNVHISAVLGLGGIIYQDKIEEELGLKDLQNFVDDLTSEQIIYTHKLMLSLAQKHVVEAHNRSDDVTLLKLLNFCKAVFPIARKIFDDHATVPALSSDTLQQQGWQRADLVTYPLPPRDLARQAQRVVVFALGGYLPLRIVHAMRAYGWQAEHVASQNGWNLEDIDFHNTTTLCRHHKADILVIFFDQMVQKINVSINQYRLIINQVKEDNPDIKIVGFSGDSWLLNKSTVAGNEKGSTVSHAQFWRQAINLLDAVWTSDSPHFDFWNEPTISPKILHLPLPHAGNIGSAETPLKAEMLSAGSTQYYSWPKAFWLYTAQHLNLPLVRKQLSCVTDGLPPLESYARHMSNLTEATCCVNFTIHSNFQPIVSHRSFEAPLSGALLVQESAPGMQRFFVPGVHYLEFSTVAELAAVSHFIVTNRQAAEKIRQAGHAYAKEHYSDEKLIGYLDHFLFHQQA